FLHASNGLQAKVFRCRRAADTTALARSRDLLGKRQHPEFGLASAKLEYAALLESRRSTGALDSLNISKAPIAADYDSIRPNCAPQSRRPRSRNPARRKWRGILQS